MKFSADKGNKMHTGTKSPNFKYMLVDSELAEIKIERDVEVIVESLNENVEFKLNSVVYDYTTEEAHQKFMKLYPRIFIEPKPVLPGIPTKRTKGVHTCEVNNVNEFGEDSHNITLYLNKIKTPQTVQFGSQEYIEKMIILSKMLKKIPILRSPEENEIVYQTLKLIPDINDQLSDEELRELMACIVREYWVKGSTVDGSQGFYAILRGSARPQTKYYKKLLGGHFVSSSVMLCSRSITQLSYTSSQTLLGVGSCFGTLIPLPTRLQIDALTVITEENCDILKISSVEYLRVKEELAKRGKLAKEELIRGSPFYQNWPLVFIFQLAAHLKWKKFPKGHVLMKVGEISKYVGFIKSGYCNAFRTVPALMKLPLGKMIKRMRQVLIGKLHPRQSFGEVSILFQIPSTYTLKTATPVELGLIEASDISDLDPVTQMLLLQTVRPSFENITKDTLKLDYIRKELEAEWKSTKDMTLNDVLFHSGITPGAGKWIHQHIRFEKGEKEHQAGLHFATYRKSM
ncbi:cyclic nucleotide-binding domain-containing protein 1 [Eublepharis macularius]|uniref:Cyclic nucleotide-binding domain-containing protein 1 n=1 Tax=Eublepharis macularius TaxID=481883 RepID=A0AA97JRY3_EUBMA|nr:cyclic nucleotide-binding domain-containing protein 1 [Eublepharis macularius]